jgi:hypothetical protein
VPNGGQNLQQAQEDEVEPESVQFKRRVAPPKLMRSILPWCTRMLLIPEPQILGRTYSNPAQPPGVDPLSVGVAITVSGLVSGDSEASRCTRFLTISSHAWMLSKSPPSIRTSRPSVGFPRTVPWNLASSPVLLCFFFRTAHSSAS